MIAAVDGGDGVGGHLDLDAFPSSETCSMFAIKGNARLTPRVVGDKTAQDNVVGKDHAAKTQDVGTNRCDQNTRNGWVDHRSTSSHTVRRGTRWTARK